MKPAAAASIALGTVVLILAWLWLGRPLPEPAVRAPAPAAPGEQRSSLAEGVVADAAEGAAAATAQPHPKFACLIEQSLDAGESDADFRAWVAASVDVFASSDDPELKLVAGLLAIDTETGSDHRRLLAAADAYPSHALIGWNYVEYCSRDNLPCGRERADVEQQALRADPGNGALLAKIAGQRYARGEVAAALEALQAAVAAPRFDSYWVEHIRAFDRALKVAPRQGTQNGIIDAIGFTAAVPDSMTWLARVCRDEATRDALWGDACLAFAGRLRTAQGTLMDEQIGLAIQKRIAEAADDPQSRALVASIDAELAAMRALTSDRSIGVIYSDETRMADYLEAMEAYGERGALRRSLVEAKRLLDSPDYDPCTR